MHATPAVVDGIAYIAGCDEILRAIRVSDGKEVFTLSSGAYTGASPAILDGRAYYGTYENEVLGVDLKTRKIVVDLQAPAAQLPVLLVGRAVGRPRVRRRPRQDGARDRREDRQGGLDVHDARAHRLVAGRRRRARLRRLERRQALRPRRRDRRDACSSSTPAARSRPRPRVASGRLVIGSLDGKLFALGG